MLVQIEQPEPQPDLGVHDIYPHLAKPWQRLLPRSSSRPLWEAYIVALLYLIAIVSGSSLPTTSHPGSIETQVPACGELGKPRWAILTPSTSKKKLFPSFITLTSGTATSHC